MFYHFGPFFTLLTTQNIKILKKWKNTWRYYFKHVYHKWQPYGVWFPRYWVWQTKLFVILNHFLPFYPLKNLKKQYFEIMKKRLEILSFYTNVPKMTIIWCIFPEIWSVTNWIFCYFGLFFALFYPLKTQNIKILENWKTPGDIIILHRCTKNHDHML